MGESSLISAALRLEGALVVSVCRCLRAAVILSVGLHALPPRMLYVVVRACIPTKAQKLFINTQLTPKSSCKDWPALSWDAHIVGAAPKVGGVFGAPGGND